MELKREEASNIYYEKRKIVNIELKEQVLNFLNDLVLDLDKYEYLSNNDFIFGGRKKFIYNEIIDVLDGKQKESNPLYFVLGSLDEFICNNNFMSAEDVDKSKWKDGKIIDGKDIAELRNKNDRYSATGYICLEEKNCIDNIINKIKEYIITTN